jgi:multidrug efflux pump subunit AcrB
VRRRHGKAVQESLRLRAILISSSTTIAGLLPLPAETSTQAGSIKPPVISVVFGLLSSTILLLLVIPALYVILDDLEDLLNSLRKAMQRERPL